MRHSRRGEEFILSEIDVFRLTGAEHADAQRARLKKMGIPFGVRPDESGTPVVTRDAARAYTGETAANEPVATLNLAGLNGPQAQAR